MELAAESIKSKLRKVGESPTKPFIYKVHAKFMHNSDDTVYEPDVVAIGPYHHGKQGLNMVEDLKPQFMKSILVRKNEEVERYISAAAEMEQAVRSCYAEPISLTSAEFVQMLALDACFIIEFLQKSYHGGLGDHDPIFQMSWFRISLEQDLMLFENQIPFFVLCKMFDLIDEPNQLHKLIKLVCYFFGKGNLYESNWNNKNQNLVKHILHLVHTISRPLSDDFINLSLSFQPSEFKLIPSAKELKDANIRFLKKESSTVYEVEFKNGMLIMPTLTIADKTEKFLRNFIIYEQYSRNNQPTYVTDYMVTLSFLVNTFKDVEILCHCGIIENITADSQKVADIINRLGLSVVYSSNTFIYSDMFTNINTHYKKPWNRARAALNRDYFNTPWAYFSFGAAVVLLLLTLAQTILSALQLK